MGKFDDTVVKGVDSNGDPKRITSIDDGGVNRLATDSKVTEIIGSYEDFILDQNRVYSVASLVNAADSSLDNPVILIKNPTGNTKRIHFLQITGNSTISNESTVIKIFANPTITSNGTVLTPHSRNVGNGAASSTIECYTLPSISADGDNLVTINEGQNSSSQEMLLGHQLALQPNNSIMITAKPESNNRTQAFTVVWDEADI